MPRSNDVDGFAKKIFGVTKTEALGRRVCVSCGKRVVSFRDAISAKEYFISGLCQECQDRVFGGT